MVTKPTHQQVSAVVNIVLAVAEAIRDLGEVPSGHLYANLSGTLTLNEYNLIIGKLRDAKVITVENHLIRWIGAQS